MNIVILDGYTLNPGDLSWEALKALGHCTVYERTAPELVVPRAVDADILLVNKVILSKEIQEQLQKLRYIGVLATGYNNVHTQNSTIVITNVPAYSTVSVAQHTFASILALTNHITEHSESVHSGRWLKSPDFCYWDYPLIELSGLTLGIVGYGEIGSTVAHIAKAFGMRVIAHTRSPEKLAPAVTSVSKEELFRNSDFISLHCPKTPETTNFVTKKELALMKPTAFLINVSRGGLVDEQDLTEALDQGQIAGAAFDVLSIEPPSENNPLLQAKNCLITPHIAWATRASRQRLLNTVVENIKAFLAGKPQNVVNQR